MTRGALRQVDIDSAMLAGMVHLDHAIPKSFAGSKARSESLSHWTAALSSLFLLAFFVVVGDNLDRLFLARDHIVRTASCQIRPST